MAASADGGVASSHSWRAWWRGLRARGGTVGQSTGAPALWYCTLRRWSPGLIPPLLGTLLLLASGALATHRLGDSPPMVDPHTLLVLFIVYLIIGPVLGLLLYLAVNVTVWWMVLMGGVAAYLISTMGVIAGPPAGVLMGIVLAEWQPRPHAYGSSAASTWWPRRAVRLGAFATST